MSEQPDLNCPDCGAPLEIERDGFDGDVTELKCAACGGAFTAQPAKTDDDAPDAPPPPGALCGCTVEGCACETPLTIGNDMAIRADIDPENEVEVHVCVECFIGNHKKRELAGASA